MLVLLAIARRTSISGTSSPSTAILAVWAIVAHGRATTITVAVSVTATHAGRSTVVVTALAVTTATATATIAIATVVVASAASAATILTIELVVALAVLLHLTLVDGWLVANIVRVACILAQSDLEHRDDTRELEVVETLLKGLILVNNGDVADLVQLVESLDAVLDQLSELHCALNSV